MKVYCPSCGAQIPADDLNLGTLLARCRKCDNVFSFADAARAELGTAAVRISPAEAATVIPCPPRIRVEELGNVWTARWQWFSVAVIFMIFFCIAWDSFLIFWYTMAFTQNGPWLMIVFPIAHVAVGVALTYSTLATLINQTTVRATRDEVSVQSGPMPWTGNRIVAAGTVKQLFSRQITSRFNNSNNASWNGQQNMQFGVFAVLNNGATIRLIGGLKDAGEAGFLQQQLETRLKIRPSPLPAFA